MQESKLCLIDFILTSTLSMFNTRYCIKISFVNHRNISIRQDENHQVIIILFKPIYGNKS